MLKSRDTAPAQPVPERQYWAFSPSIPKGNSLFGLRKVIARLFWVAAIVYGLPAVSLPLFIFRMFPDSSANAYANGGSGAAPVVMIGLIRLLLGLLAIAPGAICISSAVAAVQVMRGKPSGRAWAIACGVAFLACSLPVLAASALIAYYARINSAGFLGLPALGLIQTAAGILILIAFLPRESAQQPLFESARPARIQGDGTTSVSLYAAVAVMVGGCFLGDWLCRRWSLRAHLPGDTSFLHINLIFFAALLIAVVGHELGHMAAGGTVGMKILAFRIGPLQGALEEGRWRLVLPRSWKSACCAGVTMIPKNPLSHRRWQAVGAAAGGALANLFMGAVALLGVCTAPGSSYEPSWALLGQIATLNLTFFAVNLIPAKEAAAYSDGARIFQILTGSVIEDYRRILAMAQAITVTPFRPGDLDLALIEKIAANNTPHFDRAFLFLIACDCYFDRGQMESARQRLREAEALYEQETTYWAERCGDFVLHAACLLRDREMAEKWWQRRLSAKSWNPGKKNHFPACAYFTLTGRVAEAEAAWQAEFARASRSPETGERAFDLHCLEHLRAMLDQAAQQAVNAPA
jgi:Zn-dependent protease